LFSSGKTSVNADGVLGLGLDVDLVLLTDRDGVGEAGRLDGQLGNAVQVGAVVLQEQRLARDDVVGSAPRGRGHGVERGEVASSVLLLLGLALGFGLGRLPAARGGEEGDQGQ